MSKQNIFIINFNLLYEILDEIKENLSFKIIQYKDEDDFVKDKNKDMKNSLIVSKPKKIFSLKHENLFYLNELPIPLNKLIESINIQLIKLKFNYQSKINIKDYHLNLNSKFLSKNEVILKLTEKEIEIILYLNKNNNKNNMLDLQKNIWGYSSDMETHTVETHIYRLRKKISDRFNDQNFILSNKNGYFIY
jgi:hypothetical protein